MSPGEALQIAAASVTTVMLCPPEVPHQQDKPKVLTPANPAFRPLMVALAAPDAPRSPGPCPAMAVVPAPVLVETTALTAVVKVPVDGCGFPQQAVQIAIARAKSA